MAALADSAKLREWIGTIGQRSAEHRIAHVFWEITARRGLREKGLIRFASGELEILDAKRLEDLCGFTPNYLHLA